MRVVVSGMILIASATMAVAQRADPRALEFCQATSSAFTQIADCLPEADVAVRALDAFPTIFPPEAEPLRERCEELNGNNIAGALVCVRRAAEQAVELRQSLPEDAELNDPVFDAVADAELVERFHVEISEARSRYPERRMWGATHYHSYR